MKSVHWNPIKIMKEKDWRVETIVYLFLFAFALFVWLFVGWQALSATEPVYKDKKAFLFFQLILGLALIFVPFAFTRVTKIQIPAFTLVFYWIFLVMSVFLGTGLQVIAHVPFWDKLLHFGSGVMLTAVGIGLLGFYHKERLQPSYYILFGFSFAMMCGILWEIWEFGVDIFLDMNLQHYQTAAGVDLIGQAALLDTMGDKLTNGAGAILFLIFTFLYQKKNPQFFANLGFFKKKD